MDLPLHLEDYESLRRKAFESRMLAGHCYRHRSLLRDAAIEWRKALGHANTPAERAVATSWLEWVEGLEIGGMPEEE